MTNFSAQSFRRAQPEQEPPSARLNRQASRGEGTQQLPAQPAAPVFLDFEASSLDLICSYPIEVGVCLADGTVHSWLIRPAPLWDDWSESAQAIHGISRQQLLDEGVEVRKVAAELNHYLQDTVYSDAWTFDSFWLYRLFKAAKMQPDFHLESISMLLNSGQIDTWQTCRRQVIERFGLSVHRAANDARILHETWRAVRAQSPASD